MRIKQLDALRALAVLMVIGNHTGSPLMAWGWVGVDLFFVLSGFLVSGLLFRDFKSTGTIHIGNFLTRRGFKIYPSYYLFLAVSVAVFAANGAPFPAGRIWHDLVFVQNYSRGTYAHLWSIAVEEHFYVALPVILWWLARRKSAHPFSSVPWGCAAVGATCLLLRMATALIYPPEFYTFAAPTHLRIDSLTFGMLLSYLSEFRPEVVAKVVNFRWPLLAASVLLVVPSTIVPWDHFFTRTLGYSCLYLGFGGLLLFALHCGGAGQSWAIKRLAGLGMYSYTIYLVHVPVHHWVASHGMSASGYQQTLVNVTYLVLCVSLGILFARLVEAPFLRIRDSFIPRPDRSVLPDPVDVPVVPLEAGA